MLSGFRDFLFRGNVVDLAVAVIIGGAFGKVVEGFMKAFVEPLIAMILGAWQLPSRSVYFSAGKLYSSSLCGVFLHCEASL